VLLSFISVLENAVAVVTEVAIGIARLVLVLLRLHVGRNFLHQLPEGYVCVDNVLFPDLFRNAIFGDLLDEIQFPASAGAAAGLRTVGPVVRLGVLVYIAAALAVEEFLLQGASG